MAHRGQRGALVQFAVDSLLDGLSELVYISDPDTYQLLFRQQGRQRGLRPGHRRRNAPVLRRAAEPHVPPARSARTTARSGGAFPRMGAHEPHHEASLPVARQADRLERQASAPRDRVRHNRSHREKESFKFLASANGLNVECIRVLENDDLDAALNAVLGMVGEFLQADRTYIFKHREPSHVERLRVVRAGRVSRDPEPVRFAVVR